MPPVTRFARHAALKKRYKKKGSMQAVDRTWFPQRNSLRGEDM
jgi:hypothetical protein